MWARFSVLGAKWLSIIQKKSNDKGLADARQSTLHVSSSREVREVVVSRVGVGSVVAFTRRRGGPSTHSRSGGAGSGGVVGGGYTCRPPVGPPTTHHPNYYHAHPPTNSIKAVHTHHSQGSLSGNKFSLFV